MNEISNINELRPFTLWAANAIEKTLQLKDKLDYPAWEHGAKHYAEMLDSKKQHIFNNQNYFKEAE